MIGGSTCVREPGVDKTPSQPAPMLPARGRSLAPFLLRLAAAIALWSVQAVNAAHWVFAFQHADDDTGHAVWLARDCLERGACAAAGNPTSALGLLHGASWTRLIRYCLATGGGLAAAQVVIVASLIAATIVSSVVVWRTLSWRAGMIASLLVLPLTLATTGCEVLNNGQLLPLPLALYYASTIWFVTSRRALAALVASICLAGSMSPALECIVVVPFHLALVAVLGRRPLSMATASALTVALTFGIESSAAAAQLWRGLVVPGSLLVGMLLIVGIAAAIPTSGRRLFARIAGYVGRWRMLLLELPPPVRARVAMKLAAIYLVTAIWVGPMIAMGFRVPDTHYVSPAVFALVFFVADAFHAMADRGAARLTGIVVLTSVSLRFAPLAVGVGGLMVVFATAMAVVRALAAAVRDPGRFVGDLEASPSSSVAIAGTMLVCVMCAPDTLIYPRTRQVWPVAAAEHVVQGLYASGATFAELMGGLQGPAAYTIQTMIVNLDPGLFAEAPRVDDASPSLLALILDPAVAARTRDVLMRRDTAGGDSAVVVRSPSVMDLARVRTCSTDACTDPIDPGRCTTRDPHGRLRHYAPFFPLDGPDVARTGGPSNGEASYCVRFFIPLRMSGTGEAHWLRVEPLAPLDIRIRDVDGVSFDGTVPGPEVRLRNDAAGAGTVEIEIEAHTFGPNPFIEQPPVMEVIDENQHLLDAFRRGRITLF